jgi:hypothetical protein
MMAYQFDCGCGTSLMLTVRIRPVCRGCGKQMKLSGKVSRLISYDEMDSYNATHGSVRYVVGHSPKALKERNNG